MDTEKKPLYVIVANALRDEIIAGVYPIGAYLEPEDKLCVRFDVSRHTIREALRILREDGLVNSRRGSGTKVIPPKSQDHDIHQVMSINDLLMFADDTTFDIQVIELIKIDAGLSRQLDIPVAEEWLKVAGLRYRKNEASPLCWSMYFIPREFANIGRLLPRYKGPIFILVEDFSGLKVSVVQQQISASVIPKELVIPLSTSANSAALIVRRNYQTDEGRILQITLNTHPADRFQHTMTMRRVRKT